jgi:long-chain fatty acid transport protein
VAGARRHFAPAALAAALAAVPAPASANPVEVFGFGSAAAAQAGVGAALADDFTAVYYNPAGLAAGEGRQAGFGAQAAVSNLRVEDQRQPLTDAAGAVVGLAAPAPLGGPLAGRLRLGLGMYVLPGQVAQVRARYPDEPFFPWYDNRLQRIVLIPGVGVRVSPRLWLGASVNVLAGLEGGIVAREGSTRAIEPRVDQQVPPVARVIAGALLEPRPGLRLAAVYRQRFEVPFATRAQTEVAGEPIDLDLRAAGQFTPDQVALGGALRGARGTLALDLTWSNWSAFPGPFVEVQSALPLVGPLAGELPDVPYRDTIAARLGGTVQAGDALTVRGGYGFETSPIPADQPGTTNLLDGPKHTVGLGLGVGWRRAGGKRVRLDLHGQAQLVGARTLTKRLYDPSSGAAYDPFTSLRDEVVDDPQDAATQGVQVSNPGYPGLRSGGQVFSGGLTMAVEL